MTRTRSRTGSTVINNQEEEGGIKPTLLLNGASNTRDNNRITKRKTSKKNTRVLPAQQANEEEDTDTNSLLKSRSNSSKPRISQKQIDQLIDYILNKNMSVTKAAHKVKMHHGTANYYYRLYKNDPEKKIPLPRCAHTEAEITQEQIENLIRYIKDDRMPITQASTKANMSYKSGLHYHSKYLKDPNHKTTIPQPKQSYTQDQKNEFIGYVINDKMSVLEASKKAKVGVGAARHHYYKYFKQQNPDIATPSHVPTRRTYTQEQIKGVINYIVGDKMSVVDAAKKANFSEDTARRYYQQYLIDNNIEAPISKLGNRFTPDMINEFLRCLYHDEMTIAAAAKKANMSEPTGRKYYEQYIENQHLEVSTRFITEEQKRELIGYIVHDKMSVTAASKKANMAYHSGNKYYHQYLSDQKRDSST